MRSIRRCVLVVLVVLLAGLFGVPTGWALRADQHSGERLVEVVDRPLMIPALQQWTATGGTFALRSDARVVVREGAPAWLVAESQTLAEDLGSLLGRPVVVERLAAARTGDIVLTTATDAGLGQEGYALRVGDTFAIEAPTAAGVFYGGRTLLQLIRGGQPIPRGNGRDWPRYPERGLMITAPMTDSSPPQVDNERGLRWLKAYIADMGYLKLNHLHLHLTDNGYWAIQSDTHPEVVTPGAFSKAQIRELLAVAGRNHVEVVPEFDMPGHFGSALRAHRELQLKAYGFIEDPDPKRLDISNPAARDFVSQILDEYLPLFPSRYWHMGGDEYLAPIEYLAYPQLLADAQQRYGWTATIDDEINGFYNEVNDIVRARGKIMRAWSDQFTRGSSVQLRPDIVADWWIANSPLSQPSTMKPTELLAAGHRVFNAGWFPTYVSIDIGPVQGKSDPREAYESWNVNQFCTARIAGIPTAPCDQVDPADRRNLGSRVNVWNMPYTIQLADDLFPRLRVIAQKTWNSPTLLTSYASFEETMRGVGHAPGYAPPE